ncbi:MAG TPA: response regulator transcription factor [Micromonosporaceae bacterium]|nr:response regulator transcription factor [Micromonosporaceae bacterium]
MDLTSVLLVDDHALFAEALRERLIREPDMSPVRVAGSASEALSAAGTAMPDLAVLDVALAADDGVALAGRLTELSGGRCRVVMMTEVRSTERVIEALRVGARAWLSKTIAVDDLLRAVRGVLRGEVWLAPDVLGEVVPRLLDDRRPNVLDDLTAREHEILQCAVDGLTRSGTAERLGVSANTVRTHTQNLFAKLGAHSTLEAVATGLRNGLRASAG